MNKLTTVPIVFSGGTYGTFFEWCLYHFAGFDVVDDPAGINGSSHSYKGTHLNNIENWRKFIVDSGDKPKFVRLHPKVKKDDDVVSSIQELTNSVDQVILMYHEDDSLLLTINNKIEKAYSKSWFETISKEFGHLLSAWRQGATILLDMQPWEIREFLSFYMLPQHLSEIDSESVRQFTDPKVKKINVKHLFNDFESTIRSTLLWIGLDVKRTNFDEVHQRWISKQKHINKDSIAHQIINAAITNEYLDWDDCDLTLVDEAYIQMQLRDIHGIDLKCNGLDFFPTNTTLLRNHLLFANSK